jgi:integrase
LEIALKRLSGHFAGWKARDIDFASMQSYRLARGKNGAAPATVRWELGALRRAFNLAARSGRAELPQFPRLHVANAREGFFEPHEWQAIRAHLRPEFQDFGDFAYSTGWRTMEVLGLRWRQIDLDAHTIRLEPGTTKTGDGRLFPFGDFPELRAVIERRKALRDSIQKATHQLIVWVFFFHVRSQFHRAGDPLHHEHKGRRRACDAIRMEWRDAAVAAKLPDRIPHDFRRTAARNMERAGVPRSVAMALGGWRSESMYRRYAIASESDLRDGIARLAAFQSKGRERPESEKA